MNDLQKHKKSDGVKWVLTVIAVLLLAVAVTAAITQGFKNWNPYGWLDKKDAEETPVEENFGGMLIGDSTGDGIAVTSIPIARANYAANDISPLAESAYTLTATITPDDASNKAVDWAVSFVNAESEWAAGKTVTDYVTVTPTADGALTANVECLEAFGEQVTVTVTSRDNAEATASCTVDYAKRMTDATVTLTGDNALAGQPNVVVNSGSSVGIIRSSFVADNVGYNSSISPTYSVGTVDDDFTESVVLRFHPSFLSAFTSLGGASSMLSLMSSASFTATQSFPTGVSLWGALLQGAWTTPYAKNSFIRAAQNASNTNVPIFALGVTADGTYSDAEFTYSLRLVSSDLTVLVESVTLDETGLVF